MKDQTTVDILRQIAQFSQRHGDQIHKSLTTFFLKGKKLVAGDVSKSLGDWCVFEFPVHPLDTFIRRMEQRRTFLERMGFLMTCMSKVALGDGTILHIPQAQFGIRPNEKYGQFLKLFIRSRIQVICPSLLPGYLLSTGSSYHYIGTNLIGVEEAMRVWNIAMVVRDEIIDEKPVDVSWLECSIKCGYGSLQVFAEGDEPEPKVALYVSS
ncbi:MAG: hypothetical protein WCW14_00190 [Candidatus Paceibacterota bacterium]